MGIAPKVARDFADGVRARGRAYFSKGRVLVRVDGPGEIAAKVRGTTSYRVRLWLRGERLLASCTCPYFGPEGAGAPCKHIWATVLATDARDLLEPAEGRPLRLLAVGAQRREAPSTAPQPAPSNGHAPQQRHGYARPDGHSQRPGHAPPPGIRGPAPTPGKKGKGGPGPGYGPGPGPAGRGLPPRSGAPYDRGGKPLTKAASASSGASAKGAQPVKKAKRRLYYIVDVPATQAQGRLVIDLARRERKPDGTRGPLRPWWHTPATAAAKVDAEDLQVLEHLQQNRDTAAGNGPSPRGPSRMPGAIRRFTLAPRPTGRGHRTPLPDRPLPTATDRRRRGPAGPAMGRPGPLAILARCPPGVRRQTLDLARRLAPQARPDGPG